MTPEGAGASWIISKLAALFAGVFAGLGLALFWTPEKLQEKGRTAAIFLAGGISGGSAIIFTGLIEQWMGVPVDDLDTGMAVAALVGAGSVAIFNWIANFIRKRQHLDASEILKEGRQVVGGGKGSEK